MSTAPSQTLPFLVLHLILTKNGILILSAIRLTIHTWQGLAALENKDHRSSLSLGGLVGARTSSGWRSQRAE
mgnify:CR=1 FL=1